MTIQPDLFPLTDKQIARDWDGSKINICYNCGYTFKGPGWKIKPLCKVCDPPVSKPNVSTTVSPSTKDDICSNYHRGNKNSMSANKIAHKRKVSSRQRILSHIELYASSVGSNNGITCEELETDTGLTHQSCSARLSELRREGKIKIVGQRKTRSGSPASIYQAI